MKRRTLILAIFIFFTGLYAENKSSIAFSVKSGDDQIMSNSLLQENIILCFYETNKTKNKNEYLKNELKIFSQNLSIDKRNQLYILAIADCSTAKWPFISFWKTALIKQSKDIGYTLYGDWTGEMRDDYNFELNEANFCIINKKGVLVYQEKGLINDIQIEKIELLILSLLSKNE